MINKKSIIASFVVNALVSHYTYAEDVFNIHALELDNVGDVPADLSRFSIPGGQLPGNYLVDVFVNEDKKETKGIEFSEDPSGGISPKFSKQDLREFGVKVDDVKSLIGKKDDFIVFPISKFIPGVATKFDFSKQKLTVSVPQALISNVARGYIPPEEWDEGIPALMANYDFTGSNTSMKHDDGTSDSYFLNLHSGVNLGAWRLRNYSTWNYSKTDTSTEQSWDSINTWLQRDVKSLKGELIIGDTYTSSDIFDSFQFRGAQLVSDDNMLPDSQRGFAPVVKGIANSNAKVTIRQNDTIIYQTYVSPGAFTINDLYPTSSGGDLRVTITEADGSERNFTQSFSNVPIMQRDGRLKYAYTIGKYRSSYSDDVEPKFGQITLIYGLPYDYTIYGGSQYSEEYNSYALGIGSDLGTLGSISFDVTQAYSNLKIDNSSYDKEGQSYRLQYMKDFPETSSTVALAGYRYSTSGFYSFNEVNDIESVSDYDENYKYTVYHNKKNKLQINFTQQIMDGELGSISIDGYQQTYWGVNGHERNATIGYNNSYAGITYGINYTYSNSPENENSDQQLAFNVSIPFDIGQNHSYINYSMTSSRNGDTAQQVGVSGNAIDDHLTYSVMQGYTNHSNDFNGQLSADYKGSYGEVNAGYNYDHDSKQINYGLQGAIVAHPYGITLSQPFSGDMASVVLVKAPGAKDVSIKNNTGVATDWRGYTVVPYVTPYRRTRVQLDTEDLGDNTDIDTSVNSVIPTTGAVVLADFKTHIGNRAIFTLTRNNGQIVPFGAGVTIQNDDREYIVGDNGQVYVTGLADSGLITVTWGEEDNQTCHTNFDLNKIKKDGGVMSIPLICH